MAGIGFSLKRLFSKKGVLNLCRAYGYASVVTAGPMILGVLLLLGMSFVSRLGGMPEHDRELLNCMLTYSLLASLMVTTVFNMVVTRYVSDMQYENRQEKIMPSFFGSVALELVLCVLTYGVFLSVSGVLLVRKLLCLWFGMALVVVWTEMIYMTALRDFQAIMLSFSISLMVGFLIALILLLLGLVTLETLLLCMIAAYGLLAAYMLKLMLDYFPRSGGSHFSFLRWFDRFHTLAWSGVLIRVGLFSHLIIMYFGPLMVRVEGLFVGAPAYDVPALIAFFSLMITTVSFVTSMEVNFYPKYSNYYGLFSDRGSIRDIELAEKEMLDVLRRELVYLSCKQLFTTILFIVVGTPFLSVLFPGISSLSISYYRFLCVGYGMYAIANAMMLVELYFEDYKGALVGTALFGLVSTGVNIWQILYGTINYFGYGFFAGSMFFFFFAALRLAWFAKRLPYFLLARQNLVPDTEKGLFVWISRKADDRQKRIMRKKEEKLEMASDQLLREEGLKL